MDQEQDKPRTTRQDIFTRVTYSETIKGFETPEGRREAINIEDRAQKCRENADYYCQRSVQADRDEPKPELNMLNENRINSLEKRTRINIAQQKRLSRYEKIAKVRYDMKDRALARDRERALERKQERSRSRVDDFNGRSR